MARSNKKDKFYDDDFEYLDNFKSKKVKINNRKQSEKYLQLERNIHDDEYYPSSHIYH